MTTEDDFIAELSDDEGKRGLWVYGPRQAGSSYFVGNFYKKHADLVPGDNQKRYATLLDKQTREYWKSDKLLAANGTDYPLWEENVAIERKLDQFWDADALWLDDLRPELDSTFVKRNILLPLEVAVKSRRIVMVSGNVAPERYGSDWAKAIEAMYMVVELGER